MAHYMVQGPDGAKHVIEGPDDATPDEIESFANQTIGAPDPKQASSPGYDYYNTFAGGDRGGPSPTDSGDSRSFSLTVPKAQSTVDPLQASADAEVAREAQDNPIGHGVTDTMLSVLRGTPVGSWIDEFGAGASGLAHAVTGSDAFKPYDQAKAYMDARLRALDANSKTLGHIPTPLGPMPITTEGLKELAGGIASVPLMPLAKIWQGTSLLPTIGNAVANGIGYGALYGAGNSDGPGRIGNAEAGAIAGGGLGLLVPPVARGAGNFTSSVGKIVGGVPSELSGFARGAIDRIAPAFETDVARPSAPPGASLGADGMLLDQGPSLQAHGAGLVNSNTPARTIVSDALEARKAGAKARIQTDVDAALGRPVNLPAFTESQSQLAQARAKPLYDAFRATPIKATPELMNILDRADRAGAVDQAQRIMEIEGIDPNNARNNGQFIDLIKRGIDSLTDQAKRAGDNNMTRIYSKLSSELRDETDRILNPKNPSQSIWARARRVAGDDIRNANAVEYGQNAFSKNLSADQMRADMSKMSPAERAHAKVGAREEVRRIMSTSGTSFGDNGDSAARRLLGNDEARAKLSRISDPINAGRLVNRLDAESTFERTRQPLLNNSRTALNTEARKLYPAAEKDSASLHNLSFEGMIVGPIKKIADMLTMGAITEKNIRIATDAAKMLVAQGADRDAIANGLRKYLNNQGLSTKARVAITRVANTIGYGSRGVLVDSRTRRKSALAHP